MDAQTLTGQLGGIWKHGTGQAPCPVCQPERRRDQNALSLRFGDDGKLLLHCFKNGCAFVDIAKAVNLPLSGAEVDFTLRKKAGQNQVLDTLKNLRTARRLWNRAKPIKGTKSETYLRGRKISCKLPSTLRFIPNIYHTPSGQWGCAMVALVTPTGGVHRTFFDKKGKRVSKNAKMMLGPCAGGAVRLSDKAGPLVVCEGIETGLALLSGLLDEPHEVWAALSTSGMKALALPDIPDKLIIATDGDAAGVSAGSVLGNRAKALGWHVSLLPAPDGKDWAEVLALKASVA